jgi:hypothetical protein
VSDQRNQEARFFRNRLFAATAFTLLAGLVLVILQWRLESLTIITAPVGSSGSSWWLLLQVMIFGSIGALLTALPVLATAPSDFSPFNLPLPQALLKITLGALTAVAGLTIVEAANGHAEPTRYPSLIFLALIFGAAQQTVTQYFDRRARQILKATDMTKPSGEPTA